MLNDSHNVIETTDVEDQREFWTRLADFDVAMLTTRDADGTQSARPIRPVRVDPNGELWLFTAMDGGIASDIRRDPAVRLSFVDADDELFASLSGEAEVLHDPQKARELWSTMAGAWFPDGPDDRNLAIVRIDVHRGDYWNVKDSKLVQFFKLAAAAMRKRPVDVAVHRRFTQ